MTLVALEDLIFVLLAAPAGIMLVGWAILAFVPIGERPWLVPLAGCGWLAWSGQLAWMAGLPLTGLALLQAVVAAGIWTVRPPRWRDWRPMGAPLLVSYAVALAALWITPFPGVALWTGDYAEYVFVGEQYRQGTPASMDRLHRSPAFGTGGAWLSLGFERGLVPYQAFSALAAAASLLAFLALLRSLSATEASANVNEKAPSADLPVSPQVGRGYWLLGVISPWYLLQVVTVWPKMLAAGAILAGLVSAIRFRQTARPIEWYATGVWFALAVAIHASSALFLPLLLVAGWRSGRRLWPAALAMPLALAPPLLLVAGPFEIWSIWQLGLEGKFAATPTMHYREEEPFAWVFAGNLLATFSGWWDGDELAAGTSSVSVWPRFHLVAVWWVTWQAGTIVGILWPWAWDFRGWRRIGQVLRSLGPPWAAITAILFALVGNACLNPYPSQSGLMQTGLTPLIFLLLAPWWLPAGDGKGSVSRPIRSTAVATLLLGTLPFVTLHLAMLYAAAGHGEDELLSLSQFLYRQVGLASLANRAWPASPWIALALFALATFALNRRPRA